MGLSFPRYCCDDGADQCLWIAADCQCHAIGDRAAGPCRGVGPCDFLNIQ